MRTTCSMALAVLFIAHTAMAAAASIQAETADLNAVMKTLHGTNQVDAPQVLQSDDGFFRFLGAAPGASFEGGAAAKSTGAADAIAKDFSHFWTKEAFTYVSPTGKRYRSGYLSWNYWIAYAPRTAATPDGRPRGQYLSNGIGATNGADKNGPTAAIRSVGKIGLETAPNGASHTISFSPSMLRDGEHLDKLAAMLRAYGKTGGTALQINVVDAKTLRSAQKNPKEYRNLMVRVTGYNAYFATLGKEIQDELIARSEHNLG